MFWHKVWNCCPERYGKFQSEIPSTSGAICEKPQGGPLAPPPAGRGLTYISRSLSQRNNTYFQSKEQWHPAEDRINTWHSSSIGRALDRQSRGSDPRNVTFIGLPYDWNHRLLTVASVCSPFYAEVLLKEGCHATFLTQNGFHESSRISMRPRCPFYDIRVR